MTTLVRPATIADARASPNSARTPSERPSRVRTRPTTWRGTLTEAFTADRQAAEISDTSGVVLLAERPDAAEAENLVGYAHLVSSLAPPQSRASHRWNSSASM